MMEDTERLTCQMVLLSSECHSWTIANQQNNIDLTLQFDMTLTFECLEASLRYTIPRLVVLNWPIISNLGLA